MGTSLFRLFLSPKDRRENIFYGRLGFGGSGEPGIQTKLSEGLGQKRSEGTTPFAFAIVFQTSKCYN